LNETPFEAAMTYFRLRLFLTLLLPAASALGQLTVSPQIDPNPSPHIADWRSKPNTVRLFVTNPTGIDQSVRFDAYVEGDARGRVAEVNLKAAIPPCIVPPGTSTWNAIDAHILQEGGIRYIGSSSEETKKSGRLPEDHFRLCVRLVRYDDIEKPLSPEMCTHFQITLLLQPQLIAPANTGTSVASPTFQWSVVPLGLGEMAKYEITVVELDPGQTNAASAMLSNIPLFTRRDLALPMYQHVASDPTLEKGRTYVWQVRACDPDARYQFQNDGFSEIWTFTFNPVLPPNFGVDSTGIQPPSDPVITPDGGKQSLPPK
jgi:hypothetical protein